MYELTCPFCKHVLTSDFIRLNAATDCAACRKRFRVKAVLLQQRVAAAAAPGEADPLAPYMSGIEEESQGHITDADDTPPSMPLAQMGALRTAIPASQAADRHQIAESEAAAQAADALDHMVDAPTPAAEALAQMAALVTADLTPPKSIDDDATPVPRVHPHAHAPAGRLAQRAAPAPAPAEPEPEPEPAAESLVQAAAKVDSPLIPRRRGETIVAHPTRERVLALARERRNKSVRNFIIAVVMAICLVLAIVVLSIKLMDRPPPVTPNAGDGKPKPDVPVQPNSIANSDNPPKPAVFTVPVGATARLGTGPRPAQALPDADHLEPFLGPTQHHQIRVHDETVVAQPRGAALYRASLTNATALLLPQVRVELRLINGHQRVYHRRVFVIPALAPRQSTTFMANLSPAQVESLARAQVELTCAAGVEARPLANLAAVTGEHEGRKVLVIRVPRDAGPAPALGVFTLATQVGKAPIELPFAFGPDDKPGQTVEEWLYIASIPDELLAKPLAWRAEGVASP